MNINVSSGNVNVLAQPLAEAAGASGSVQPAPPATRPSLVPGAIKLEKPGTFSGKHSEV